MRIIQFRSANNQRHVGLVGDGMKIHPLAKVSTVFELALKSANGGRPIADLVAELASDDAADYLTLLGEGRVLTPLDHPEPARFMITGTGLTHIGSAAARNRMHLIGHGEADAEESDSMKIFRMGLEGGKPAKGTIGIQPEWFFKGVGTCVVAPDEPLPLPHFAEAGAEEAEIAGLYIVDEKGAPCRIGYALGNEYSDHVTEGKNYLYLAHSKLRACSLGPELLLGDLPDEVRGVSRIVRNGKTVWEEEFLSGEKYMSHSIENLEHYHFRYPMFRRPGDLHAYFFGAAVMSYAAGVQTQPDDEYEISADVFGQPLRNRMVAEADEGMVTVRAL
ncbi:MAG: FAH family protein [Rhizobiaceae bacterium]|nr:FAH family protein [Rhizobiaceae bacterium]